MRDGPGALDFAAATHLPVAGYLDLMRVEKEKREQSKVQSPDLIGQEDLQPDCELTR